MSTMNLQVAPNPKPLNPKPQTLNPEPLSPKTPTSQAAAGPRDRLAAGPAQGLPEACGQFCGLGFRVSGLGFRV